MKTKLILLAMLSMFVVGCAGYPITIEGVYHGDGVWVERGPCHPPISHPPVVIHDRHGRHDPWYHDGPDVYVEPDGDVIYRHPNGLESYHPSTYSSRSPYEYDRYLDRRRRNRW